MEISFYKCNVCGKIILMIKDSGVPTICCGEPMTLIKANSSDGMIEKHVPVISMDNNQVITVTVGETYHPMGPEHYIEWILLQTNKGIHKKDLSPNDLPVANFALTPDEKVIAAYENCNIHNLWKNVG